MKTASLASAHGTAHADEKNRSDSEHTRDGNSSIDLSAFGIQIESEETRRRQEALQERRRAAMQKQQLRTELRDTVQHGRTLDLSARNLHSLGNAMGIPDSTRPHTHADRGGELGPSFEILSTPKISTQWSDLKPSKSSVSLTTTDHRENRSTLFSNAMQPNEAGAAPSHLTPQCFLTPPKLTPHGSVPMQDNTMSGWGMWVVDRSVQTDVSGVGVQNDEDATRSPTPKKLLSLCPLCRANHSVQCSSHDRVWNHDDRALCTQGLESKNERMGGTLQPHQEQVYLSIIYSLRQQLENLHVKLACVIRESAV